MSTLYPKRQFSFHDVSLTFADRDNFDIRNPRCRITLPPEVVNLLEACCSVMAKMYRIQARERMVYDMFIFKDPVDTQGHEPMKEENLFNHRREVWYSLTVTGVQCDIDENVGNNDIF